MSSHTALLDAVHDVQLQKAHQLLDDASPAQLQAALKMLFCAPDWAWSNHLQDIKNLAQAMLTQLGSAQVEGHGLLAAAVDSNRASMVALVASELFEDSDQDWQEGLRMAVEKHHLTFFQTFLPFVKNPQALLGALTTLVDEKDYHNNFKPIAKALCEKLEKNALAQSLMPALITKTINRPVFNDTAADVLTSLTGLLSDEQFKTLRAELDQNIDLHGRRLDAFDDAWRLRNQRVLGDLVKPEIDAHPSRVKAVM